jgi:hypothetical protein
MHYVDVLYVEGLPDAQAVVVDGVLMASSPGEGIGDFLTAPQEFFSQLGRVMGAGFHVSEHTLSYGLPTDWTWPDVVDQFRAGLERGLRKQLLEMARGIVQEHYQAWQDGYTPDDAGEVLARLNDMVRAARLSGQVVLVWEYADRWGPGGGSDLFYVSDSGAVVSASAAYRLVWENPDHRPFVNLLHKIRAGKARFEGHQGFPVQWLPGYAHQGIDPRAC